MMTFIWIVLGIVSVAALLFIVLWLNTIRASFRRDFEIVSEVGPVLKAVEENDLSANQLVNEAAQNPATRTYLFGKLKEMNRTEMFPDEFHTLEKFAESELVRWLMHPNELNAAPSEIHLVRRIPIHEGEKTGTLFLFRFLTDSTHWAWDSGWMAGVAGVYWDGEEWENGARETFSELTPFNAMTEDEHVEYLRAAMQKKGLVVPS